MKKMKVMFGFDMETDIGSWTSMYKGFKPGTENILSGLDKYGVKATFFFTGDAIKNNPDVAKMLIAQGHEVGAHSLFHETVGDALFEIPGVYPILNSEVENRLKINTEMIEEITGVRPISFRCPRLWGSTTVVNALENLGYVADATYPMYFYRDRITPYHPSKDDWTKDGDMKLVEIPIFANLSLPSNDKYGRDLDQWPRWRTESAAAVCKDIEGYVKYCDERNVEPFLCFYMHPWEFAPMQEGLIHSGEGAVLPDPFIIKNCGKYATEQFEVLVGMLKDMGAEFYMAKDVAKQY